MLTTNKFICFPDEAFRHPAASMRDARLCRDQGTRFVEAALFNAFIVMLFIEHASLKLTKIVFPTRASCHRTLLMCSSDKFS